MGANAIFCSRHILLRARSHRTPTFVSRRHFGNKMRIALLCEAKICALSKQGRTICNTHTVYPATHNEVLSCFRKVMCCDVNLRNSSN